MWAPEHAVQLGKRSPTSPVSGTLLRVLQQMDAFRRFALSITSSRAWVLSLVLGTAFSIFAYDIRLLAGKQADTGFLVAATVLLALFFTEVVFLGITLQGYVPLPRQRPHKKLAGKGSPSAPARFMCTMGSYAFWLDVVAVVSLAVELWLVVSEDSTAYPSNAHAEYSDAIIAVVRTGRTTRVGARLTRLLPLVRPWRILKAVNCIREAWDSVLVFCGGCRRRSGDAPMISSATPMSESRSSRAGASVTPATATGALLRPAEHVPSASASETRVGAALRHLMGLHSSAGIAFLVLVVPLFNYALDDSSNEVWLNVAHSQLLFAASAALYNCSSQFNDSAAGEVFLWGNTMTAASCNPLTWGPKLVASPGFVSAVHVLAAHDPTLLSLSVNGSDVPPSTLDAWGVRSATYAFDASTLRASELQTIVYTSWLLGNGTAVPPSSVGSAQFQTIGVWSLRSDVVSAALLDIGFSAVIVGILFLGALMFNVEIDRSECFAILVASEMLKDTRAPTPPPVVLRPLAFIIDVVRRISANPLARLVDGGSRAQGPLTLSNEVRRLLRTLLNMGDLLRTGFGEGAINAGAGLQRCHSNR